MSRLDCPCAHRSQIKFFQRLPRLAKEGEVRMRQHQSSFYTTAAKLSKTQLGQFSVAHCLSCGHKEDTEWPPLRLGPAQPSAASSVSIMPSQSSHYLHGHVPNNQKRIPMNTVPTSGTPWKKYPTRARICLRSHSSGSPHPTSHKVLSKVQPSQLCSPVQPPDDVVPPPPFPHLSGRSWVTRSGSCHSPRVGLILACLEHLVRGPMYSS